MPRAAEPEIVVLGGKLVAVENDLALAAMARHAAELFVLAALAEFSEIGVSPVRRRYAGIIFLDPPAHLRDQLLLQGRGVTEHALGVGVLRFEIGADIRIEHRRVAKHFLPVWILEPGVVVADDNTVPGKGMRPTWCNRRGLRRLRGCLCHSVLIFLEVDPAFPYGTAWIDCHKHRRAAVALATAAIESEFSSCRPCSGFHVFAEPFDRGSGAAVAVRDTECL